MHVISCVMITRARKVGTAGLRCLPEREDGRQRAGRRVDGLLRQLRGGFYRQEGEYPSHHQFTITITITIV